MNEYYTRILQQHLRDIIIEEVVAEEQARFRAGRSRPTIDELFAVRQLSEKYLEKNRTLSINQSINQNVYTQKRSRPRPSGKEQSWEGEGIENRTILLSQLIKLEISATRILLSSSFRRHQHSDPYIRIGVHYVLGRINNGRWTMHKGHQQPFTTIIS